jgi:hypothetical protein
VTEERASFVRLGRLNACPTTHKTPTSVSAPRIEEDSIVQLRQGRQAGIGDPESEPENPGGDRGTTGSRVSFFMNRFRKMGFNDYKKGPSSVVRYSTSCRAIESEPLQDRGGGRAGRRELLVCEVSKIAQLLRRKYDIIDQNECTLIGLPRAGVSRRHCLEGKREPADRAEVATGIEHVPPE